MQALVVFESMFGNTEVIARAIGEGLAGGADVEVVEVGAAPHSIPGDIRLLVVGGPTHGFGMSREGTRRTAKEQATQDVVSRSMGIREWLDVVEGGDVGAAAFDTSLAKPRFIRTIGTAAASADKHLRRLGFRMVASPESFWVAGTPGPLLEGEANRARAWGRALVSTVRSPESSLGQG